MAELKNIGSNYLIQYKRQILKGVGGNLNEVLTLPSAHNTQPRNK
jgi:hypothetical protein